MFVNKLFATTVKNAYNDTVCGDLPDVMALDCKSLQIS